MIKYAVRVYESGTKKWYLNGKLHCEHGPALEYSDGFKGWYLNGEYLTEAEWKKTSKQDLV